MTLDYHVQFIENNSSYWLITDKQNTSIRYTVSNKDFYDVKNDKYNDFSNNYLLYLYLLITKSDELIINKIL